MTLQICATPHNKTTSFFDLSSELRNKIYHSALISDDPVQVQIAAPLIWEPALLRSSCRIRKEALEMFYAHNIFEVKYVSRLTNLIKWFDPERLAMIKMIHLEEFMVEDFRKETRKMLHEVSEACSWSALSLDAILMPVLVYSLEDSTTGQIIWTSAEDIDKFETVYIGEGDERSAVGIFRRGEISDAETTRGIKFRRIDEVPEFEEVSRSKHNSTLEGEWRYYNE